MVGRVVTSSSSMMRGLVRATYALSGPHLPGRCADAGAAWIATARAYGAGRRRTRRPRPQRGATGDLGRAPVRWPGVSGPSSTSRPDRPSRLPTVSVAGFRRLCVASLVMVALIVVTGAAVRLTGSGLGCSDWPACTTAT